MKNQKTALTVIRVAVVLLLCISWSVVGFTQNKTENSALSFKAKTNKQTYLLGEPVNVEFEFFNQGENSLIIPSGGVEVGSLKVFISSEDKNYKEYFASGWGRLRGSRKTLEPKQSYKYQATVLWNGKPDVSHLNEDAAKRALEGKIATEYAFPNSGIYLIKGVSHVGENATRIESEPTQIVVNEPVGDDLQVWNQIKGNREIAYLLQKGEFRTGENEEKPTLLAEVEHLIQEYPDSTYSGYLKQNLEKFRANEQRRTEFMEKIKHP